MVDRALSTALVPGEFLVCYDYGTGGLWGVLIAPSEGAIRAEYPELLVAATRPTWMDEAELGSMRVTPLRLNDDPPRGLLRVLVSDRERS